MDFGLIKPKAEHSLLRHVTALQYDESGVDGAAFRVDGSAFQLRDKLADGKPELGLSVANIEMIDGGNLVERLEHVWSSFPKQLKKSHRFAAFTIDDASETIRKTFSDHIKVDQLSQLDLIHAPVEAAEGKPAFECHCEVWGLPPRADLLSAAVGEAISYIVSALHPATKPVSAD